MYNRTTLEITYCHTFVEQSSQYQTPCGASLRPTQFKWNCTIVHQHNHPLVAEISKANTHPFVFTTRFITRNHISITSLLTETVDLPVIYLVVDLEFDS